MHVQAAQPVQQQQPASPQPQAAAAAVAAAASPASAPAVAAAPSPASDLSTPRRPGKPEPQPMSPEQQMAAMQVESLRWAM